MVIGKNRVPWFYPESTYFEMLEVLQNELLPSDLVAAYDRSFAFSQKIEIDSQGRTALPMDQMKWADFEQRKDFYLVGCRNRLEMHCAQKWDRANTEMATSHFPQYDEARKEYQKLSCRKIVKAGKLLL